MNAPTPAPNTANREKAPIWDRITPSLLFLLEGEADGALPPADRLQDEAAAFFASHRTVESAIQRREAAVLRHALAQCDAAAAAIAKIAADARVHVATAAKAIDELTSKEPKP